MMTLLGDPSSKRLHNLSGSAGQFSNSPNRHGSSGDLGFLLILIGIGLLPAGAFSQETDAELAGVLSQNRGRVVRITLLGESDPPLVVEGKIRRVEQGEVRLQMRGQKIYLPLSRLARVEGLQGGRIWGMLGGAVLGGSFAALFFDTDGRVGAPDRLERSAAAALAGSAVGLAFDLAREKEAVLLFERSAAP